MSRSEANGRARLLRDLPLFWKLQVPFAALLLVVGAFGTFLITRDLSSRAGAELEADLQRAALDAQATVVATELFLLESANLSANLDGMHEALAAGATQDVDRLLQTVLALKADLDLLAVLDATGTPLLAYLEGVPIDLGAGETAATFVTAALDDAAGRRHAGTLEPAGEPTLAIAAPVCPAGTSCDAVGVTIVGRRLDRVAAAMGVSAGVELGVGGIELIDVDGRQLAQVGTAAATDATSSIATPLLIDGSELATAMITIPRDPSAVEGAARRLALVLLAALLGIILIGALISRTVTRQVFQLSETNRALGAGDLSARAPEAGTDEIGQLAAGLNRMAEQLQASHATLESRVEERTGEVHRLLDERTQFFASLSHELRTPLAIILSEADLVAEDGDAQTKESAEAIRHSAAALLSSVNDILDLARAEAGKLDLVVEGVDLGQAVAGLRGILASLGRSADVDVTVAVPTKGPEVAADPARLRDVVLNLVTNGVKYTPAGGEVTVRVTSDDARGVLTITDTEIGIPRDVGDRIFEPFHRVPGNEPQAGQPSSGLGLALTRGVVEALDGTITYRSSPGQGTTFTVALPLLEATSD